VIKRNESSPPTESSRSSAFIFNWIFIPGLLLLFLNDHYLKWEYSNWITGKLSDFVGLLIFPMFLQFLFPRFSRFSILATGALFVFWKLPVSDLFITFYNRLSFIPITRTVDYSDLIALSVLPLAGYFIKKIEQYKIPSVPPAFIAWLAMIPISLIFMATSPPESFVIKQRGYIYIGKSYKLKISKEDALAKLKTAGFSFEPDTSRDTGMGGSNFVIKNAVLDGGKDTIKAIRFGFIEVKNKTSLLIRDVTIKDTDDTKHWRLLRKYYRRLVQSGVVEDID
jgi:hypothetical protein